MIRAVIFDFGQTLVDSAEGFRSAEKQVEKKIFDDLALTSWQEFLENYRKIRRQFHEKSSFSRKAISRSCAMDAVVSQDILLH